MFYDSGDIEFLDTTKEMYVLLRTVIKSISLQKMNTLLLQLILEVQFSQKSSQVIQMMS